ncbi:MAG: pyridoxal phosphate-dependent aminotransferase family protein [Oligoflexia bacterium]|nr:pyridoxal phosphate-dependent aminotransferase family protein [Oligoflexia bacterium]
MLRDLRLESEQYQAVTPQRELPTAERFEDGCIEVRGKRVVDFSSWDYLGLSRNPRVVRAAQLGLAELGVSAGSSRLFGGSTIFHKRAEGQIAKFLGQQSAISFSSRNQAILSLATSVLSERDALVCDEHTSLPCSDAAYLSNASVHYFRSSDPDTLDVALESCAGKRRRLLVIETLSPSTGAQVGLPEIMAIARRHSAGVILDESFAVGALGARGAGVSEGFQFGEELIGIIVDCCFGLASSGTYVSGSQISTDFLVSRSRTFQSEAAPCPALCAALEVALDACELSIQLRARLLGLASYFSNNLRKTGLNVSDTSSQIVSIAFERRSLARSFCDALFQRGSLCDLLSQPTAFNETCMARFVIRACHSEAQLDATLQSVSDIVQRVAKD